MNQDILKGKIEKIWDTFHSGGITNPLTVIEQITYLIFFRLLDAKEIRNEKRAARTNQEYKSIYSKNEKELRWSNLKHKDPKVMFEIFQTKLFTHLNKIMNGNKVKDNLKSKIFSDAQFMIQKPSLLVEAFNLIDELPLTSGDIKGDIYELLLSKLTTAGINGQFRTPRHIIQLMVEMIDPRPQDRELVADPACGTGGFLVGVLEYLMRTYSSPELIETHKDGSKSYPGDLLEKHLDHIKTNMLYGYDFDVTMLRIAYMNLLLHSNGTPNINYCDTLSSSFTEHFPETSTGAFDIVLANPPFQGSIDFESINPLLLRKVKTKNTEILFLTLILSMLKKGGRAAVIVPDGVIFRTSKAHIAIRQYLLEENQLDGVVSLPGGVFKPYAGVSTSILLFTRGGQTKDVFFYNLEDDGFTLDDNRKQKYDDKFAGDLPDILKHWQEGNKENTERHKTFFVPLKEIVENKYDLSINRYKEIEYGEIEYDPPDVILDKLESLEKEIQNDLKNIRKIL